MTDERSSDQNELDVSQLLEELEVVVYATDSAGHITDVSPAIEQVLGYSQDELVGRPLEQLIVPESHQRLAEQRTQKLSGELDLTIFELVARRKDGSSTHVQICSEPLKQNGRIVGERGILHVARSPETRHIPAERTSLTPRQLQVLRLLSEGLGTDAIAQRLSISVQTARNHIQAVLRQLGCHSRLEAIAVGRRLGLLD